MTDVENGAARREEAHRGDSWIGAGVTEVDVKDGVRWRPLKEAAEKRRVLIVSCDSGDPGFPVSVNKGKHQHEVV